VCMAPCLPGYTPDCGASVRRNVNARTHFGQRRHVERSDAVPLAVHRRAELVALNEKLLASGVVAGFSKPRQVGEPIVLHGEHVRMSDRHIARADNCQAPR
jgi:hypothetical protein